MRQFLNIFSFSKSSLSLSEYEYDSYIEKFI